MDFIKKMLVFIAASTFALFLLLTVTTTAISTIVNPTNIKAWLKHSDVYYGAIDAILDSTANSAQKNTKESTDAFSKPEVKIAIKKAFPPSLLQSSTENFIDGTFVWLEGKSDKPTFKIDLQQAKKNMANNLADYAQNRYKTLPICKTLPSNDTSPLDAACRVSGYDISKDLQKFKTDLINNKDLFGDPAIITADSIKSGNNKSFFDDASQAPQAYSLAKNAPYIFGVLSIIMGVALLFVSKTKYKGLHRISLSLIYSAVLLFLTAGALSAGVSKASSGLADSGNSSSNFAKSTALSIGQDIGNHVVKINLIFGTIFLITAIGLLLFANKKLKPKSTESKQESKPESTKLDETPPKKDNISPKE